MMIIVAIKIFCGLFVYVLCACVSCGYWSKQDYVWRDNVAPAALWPLFLIFGNILFPLFSRAVSFGEWLGTPRKSEKE